MKQVTTGTYLFQDLRNSLGIEVVYGENVSHDFSRHTHRALCVGAVEVGVRTLLCRGNEYKVSPGQIFLIPPNEAHACSTRIESHTYRLILILSDVLRKILPDFEEHQTIFTHLVVEDKNLFEQLLTLHLLLDSSETNFIKQSVLVSVIGDIVKRCVAMQDDLKVRHKQYESIKRAQTYIEDHYEENFSLDDLAAYAYLSPYYLIRAFGRIIGLPPHIYQQQVRIRHAKEMLGHSISLAEVADQTGFADQSHFSNVFKKIVGVTPGEYKKSCRQDSTPLTPNR